MTITLYKCRDDKRVVDKTLPSDTKIDITAVIKADTDILNPVLELSYDSSIISSGYNYMYIPSWKRYYFITDISFSMQRMFISGKVDVLTTYATEIKNLTGIVLRQQAKKNADMYLPDFIFAQEAVRDVEMKFFRNSAGKVPSFSNTLHPVLCLACDNSGL